MGDVNRAANDYNSICKSSKPCECKIKIGFAPAEDFPNPRMDVGISTVSNKLASSRVPLDFVDKDCKLDCSKLFIKLNQYEGSGFVSGSYTDANWTNHGEQYKEDQITKGYNLVAVIRSFISELTNANAGISSDRLHKFIAPTPPQSCSCEPNNAGDLWTGKGNTRKTNPSVADCNRCMFKKLYCPDIETDRYRLPVDDDINVTNK